MPHVRETSEQGIFKENRFLVENWTLFARTWNWYWVELGFYE